jgi:hypothetical protein
MSCKLRRSFLRLLKNPVSLSPIAYCLLPIAFLPGSCVHASNENAIDFLRQISPFFVQRDE